MPRAGLNIKIVTRFFFDQKKVIDALPPAKRRALSKIGAFIRTRARSLMKRRKKTAPPNTPPSAHAGQLKDLLFFSYDPMSESVVVGPVPFKAGEAPALSEYGGVAQRRAWTWRPRRGRYGRKYEAKYRKRPFMKPALDESVSNPKLVEAWKDSIKPTT